MSIVYLIDTLTDWARENICTRIKLKQPPTSLEAPTDEDYEYTLVTPAAFGMYVPTSEKLPPNIHSPFPSLCVRFTSGQDEMSGGGYADIQFCFSTWDTGIHGEDVLLPDGKGGSKRWTGEDADAYFRRSGEGWRDAWNFVDIALRAIESVTNINGFVIDNATPIKFGPLTEQEAIPDMYPMWFAWVSFRVNYPLVRNNLDFQKYL